MYWENELRCPHCKAVQTDYATNPLDEWRQAECESCGEPFKFIEETVSQFTTMSPALEAVRERQREDVLRLMEKKG